MPVTHLYMPEERLLKFSPDVFADPDRAKAFFPDALEQGAELTTYKPGTTTDITPFFMQQSSYPHYYLEMGSTPETAMVHEMRTALGSGSITVSLNVRLEGQASETHRTFRIPDEAEAHVIAAPLSSRAARFGCAVLYWSQAELDQHLEYWRIPPEPLF